MTSNQFNMLCNELCIDPAIALENDEVIKSIPEGIEAVKQAILDNF